MSSVLYYDPPYQRTIRKLTTILQNDRVGRDWATAPLVVLIKYPHCERQCQAQRQKTLPMLAFFNYACSDRPQYKYVFNRRLALFFDR